MTLKLSTKSKNMIRDRVIGYNNHAEKLTELGFFNKYIGFEGGIFKIEDVEHLFRHYSKPKPKDDITVRDFDDIGNTSIVNNLKNIMQLVKNRAKDHTLRVEHLPPIIGTIIYEPTQKSKDYLNKHE